MAAVSFMASTALAWGPGVHLYVADQAAKKAGWKNQNEMYGAMGPDVVNYLFSSPDLMDMYATTHFQFGLLWDAASTPSERALALGFVTHNNAWGADYTAHSSSLTLDPAQGYVIQKAAVIAGLFEQDPAYAALNIPHGVTLEIAHNMVENAIELLMAQVEPGLGQKMVAVAAQRDPAFPALLAKAYAGPFAAYFGGSQEMAAGALVEAEAMFQQLTIAQGTALQQDLATALDQLAELNVQMAQAFLMQYGVQLPAGAEIKPLIVSFISAGMVMCEDDFADEILGTVEMVRAQLPQQGYRFPQY